MALGDMAIPALVYSDDLGMVCTNARPLCLHAV